MQNAGFRDDLQDLVAWYQNLPYWAKYIIGPILGVLVCGGIIGGASWALAQDVFSHLSSSVRIPLWAIVVAVVVVIVSVLFLLWSRHRVVVRSSRLLQTERAVFAHSLRMDDDLFLLMPKLVRAGNREREQAAKRLLRKLLRSGCAVFDGRVSRASLLVPSQRDYLKPWVTNMMPPESVQQMTFYIGRDSHLKRGIAGKAYVSKQMHVVHITQDPQTKRWIPDDDDYQPHNGSEPPNYRSFVAVPILLGSVVRGVLCFDSMDPNIFDSPEIQKVLESLAQRIATALEVYEGLGERQSSTTGSLQTPRPASTPNGNGTPPHERSAGGKPKPGKPHG